MDLSPLSAFPQISPCVKTMILARPDYRKAADIVHQHCLNLACAANPGFGILALTHPISTPYYGFLDSLKDFRDGKYLLPGALNGSDINWWRDYSTTLGNQVFNQVAKRPADSGISEALRRYEATLESFGYIYYADAYVLQIDGELKRAWLHAQYIGTDVAREEYMSVLTNSATIHMIWAISGMWPDIKQELYHHLIKLTQLYATPAELDDLLRVLKSKGIPIPPEVDVGTWHRCANFRGGSSWLTVDDLLAYHG